MTSLTSKSLFLFFLLFSIICLSFSIPSEYPILSHEDDDLDKFTTEEDICELCQMWQKKYGREYESVEDRAKRFEIFKTNLNHIREKNAKRKSGYGYRLGLNKFSDLTFEEFSKTYLGLQQPKIEGNIHEKMECNDINFCPEAPPSFDWRAYGAVTRVKDQAVCGNVCGSCWAFSATGAIEGIYKITTGKLVEVSEQQLVSCVRANKGCNGGWYTRAFEYVIENGGIASADDYPYIAHNGTCDHHKEKLKAATIDGSVPLPPRCEKSIFCAVAKQPVSIALYVSDDFKNYKQGIFDGSSCIGNENCGNCSITHAVLIVGYGSINHQDYWIVKNSWGYSWGQDGYIFIKRNTGIDEGAMNSNCWGAYPTKRFEPLLDSAI